MPKKQAKGAFIEPMLLLRTEKLSEGPGWLIELKLDGYRALIKSDGKVQLRSRNNNAKASDGALVFRSAIPTRRSEPVYFRVGSFVRVPEEIGSTSPAS